MDDIEYTWVTTVKQIFKYSRLDMYITPYILYLYIHVYHIYTYMHIYKYTNIHSDTFSIIIYIYTLSKFTNSLYSTEVMLELPEAK